MRQISPISSQLRFLIFRRDNYKCRICGATSTDSKLEIDHIIPASKGGTNEPSNLWTLCFECNRGKKSELLTPEIETALKYQQEEFKRVISEEIFKKVVDMNEISHELRAKIIGMPISTYYYKLRKYKDEKGNDTQKWLEKLEKERLDLEIKIKIAKEEILRGDKDETGRTDTSQTNV